MGLCNTIALAIQTQFNKINKSKSNYIVVVDVYPYINKPIDMTQLDLEKYVFK